MSSSEMLQLDRFAPPSPGGKVEPLASSSARSRVELAAWKPALALPHQLKLK